MVVEDTGHGIEPEHLPHLFERFYRTDWARAKDSGGTGLGLAIIKEIMEAHGGTVSVTSKVDKGSGLHSAFSDSLSSDSSRDSSRVACQDSESPSLFYSLLISKAVMYVTRCDGPSCGCA